MSNRINGKRGAFLQPLRYGVDESGPYTMIVFKGTVTDVKAKIADIELGLGLWEIQESEDGLQATLTARYPTFAGGTGADVPDNEWEIFGQSSEKDILEADNPIVNALTDTEKRAIRSFIANPDQQASPAIIPGSSADKLYKLMLNGLKSVRVFVTTLRKTQQVTASYQVPASFANVGRIYTTTSLIDSEPLMRADIAANLANVVSNRTGLGYGWFKMAPTIRSAAKQKTQIIQEWEYGLWADDPAIYQAFL